MKKKVLALTLVVAVLAILAGTTFAYFTDSADRTNVFTVGNVKIELYESMIHRGADSYLANGTEGYLPEGYTNGAPTDDQIIAADAIYDKYLAAQELLPGVSVNKMPFVKNTGKSDAYVRIRVLVPTALNLSTLNSSVICTTALATEFSRPEGVGDYDVDSTTTIDGVDFDVYTFIRNEALVSGEMTNWNVWNTITMDTDVTMDDYNALVEAGAITENGTFNVIIQADAIQAATFATATEAFAAFDA